MNFTNLALSSSCDCPCHILPPALLHGVCWCDHLSRPVKTPSQEYKEVK